MNIKKTIKTKSGKGKAVILSLLFVCLFVLIVLFCFYTLWFSPKEAKEMTEATIIKKEFDKNEALANHEDFRAAGKYYSYRQGVPEQIFLAEDPDLPFSEIETYTAALSLDKSLEYAESIDDITMSCIPEGCNMFRSEEEISIKRESDGACLITLYFTDKTGAPYPDCGNAVFSECCNISVIIFKPNDDLYCSAVGRDISLSNLSDAVQSLSKRT